jgi:hypothetical protein
MLDATNRRGNNIRVLVSCMALMGPDGGRHGVIVTMEQVQP